MLMHTAALNTRDIDFLVYKFLDTESPLTRERYVDYRNARFLSSAMHVPRSGLNNVLYDFVVLRAH